MKDKSAKVDDITGKAFVVMNAQVFPIKKSVTSIGRKLSNDLVIRSSQVSRFHAEIRYQDEKFMLHDLDSTSGTFINNVQVEESALFSGDLILVANIPMMFVDETDPLYKEMEKRTDQLKKKGE
jgi:pSer/pThr/pTyr-binding forkhead associated (FHA) protein